MTPIRELLPDFTFPSRNGNGLYSLADMRDIRCDVYEALAERAEDDSTPEFVVCSRCLCVEEDEEAESPWYCEECEAMVASCDCCGDNYDARNGYGAVAYNGNNVCESCLDSYFVSCPDCDELVHHEDTCHGVCPNCSDNYYACEECGCTVHADDAYGEGEGCYCRDCWDDVGGDRLYIDINPDVAESDINGLMEVLLREPRSPKRAHLMLTGNMSDHGIPGIIEMVGDVPVSFYIFGLLDSHSFDFFTTDDLYHAVFRTAEDAFDEIRVMGGAHGTMRLGISLQLRTERPELVANCLRKVAHELHSKSPCNSQETHPEVIDPTLIEWEYTPLWSSNWTEWPLAGASAWYQADAWSHGNDYIATF